MSSADRDWFRGSDGAPLGWGGTPACWSLIAIQASLWALPSRVGAGDFFDSLALRLDDILVRGRLYEVATYAVAPGRDSPWDLLWAVACLLVFGREIEVRFGWRRFLALYGVAVLLVGVVAVPWMALIGRDGDLVGGAGAAISVLVAFAASRPYATVAGVPAGIAVAVLVALPACQHLLILSDATWAAHLSGAGAGFWFASRFVRGKAASAMEPGTGEERRGGIADSKDLGEEEEGLRARVDRLLARIQREGLDSLTDEERAFLRRASKRFRG